MDTRKLEYRKGHEPHNQALIYDEGASVDVAVTYSDKDGITAAELVRRWNAYPELVEALKGLVQTIEFQAEGNFLNEDADEGEENDLTRARTILATLKTN